MPYQVQQGPGILGLVAGIMAGRQEKKQRDQENAIRQKQIDAQIASNTELAKYREQLGAAATTRAQTGQENAGTNRQRADTQARGEAEKERYDKSLELFRAKGEALKQAQFDYAKTKDTRAFAQKQQQINNAYNIGIQRIAASVTVAQIHASATTAAASIHAAATVDSAKIRESGTMQRQQQKEQFDLKHPGVFGGRTPTVTTQVQGAMQTLATRGMKEPSDPNFGMVLDLWAKHPLERSSILKSDKVPAETKAYLQALGGLVH